MSTPANSIDCLQGSQMWAELRCGNVTASRASDVIAMTKKGESADRRNYRTELLCERLTGVPYPQYVTKEMQWGTEQEPFARAAYELQVGVLVDTVGFVLHPSVPRFGCSPDGYVGEIGMVQFKCPNTTTHLGWMLGGTIPVEHVPQLLAELSCNPEREWIDFCSFDPRLPEHLQLWMKRYERNPKLISALEAEVVHFNAELDQVLMALPPAPQAVAAVLDWPKADETEF